VDAPPNEFNITLMWIFLEAFQKSCISDCVVEGHSYITTLGNVDEHK